MEQSTITTFADNLLQLLSTKLFVRKYYISWKEPDLTRKYKTREEVEKIIEICVQRKYEAAIKYFDTDSKYCISNDTARFYGSRIESVFQEPLDYFQDICDTQEQLLAFEQLKNLVRRSQYTLLQNFNEIIHSKPDFYSITKETPDYELVFPPKNMIQEGLDDKHYRNPETGEIEYFIHIPELLNSSYITNELNYNAYLFFTEAYEIYKQYTEQLEQLVATVCATTTNTNKEDL